MFWKLFSKIKKNNFILAKHLSGKQKEKILELFLSGKTIDELSIEFGCTKLTISRNLKKNFGEDKFKFIKDNNRLNNKISQKTERIEKASNTSKTDLTESLSEDFYKHSSENEFLQSSSFTEITPLLLDIDNEPQKDYTSVSLEAVKFPEMVYMVVDKNIELNIKSLKDYPEWQYLSESELNRKTIEIFFELKLAKLKCNKDQKVIKVPNTKVFEIVRPILISKGISRIINNDQLIAL